LNRERRTTKDRREEYQARMDAKAAAREELRQEGEAGIWSNPEDFEKDA
jgi:GTP-binding protein